MTVYFCLFITFIYYFTTFDVKYLIFKTVQGKKDLLSFSNQLNTDKLIAFKRTI